MRYNKASVDLEDIYMERVRVLENVFTVIGVCLLIVILSELSIAGLSASVDIVRANAFSIFLVAVLMSAAFFMNVKRKHIK